MRQIVLRRVGLALLPVEGHLLRAYPFCITRGGIERGGGFAPVAECQSAPEDFELTVGGKVHGFEALLEVVLELHPRTLAELFARRTCALESALFPRRASSMIPYS